MQGEVLCEMGGRGCFSTSPFEIAHRYHGQGFSGLPPGDIAAIGFAAGVEVFPEFLNVGERIEPWPEALVSTLGPLPSRETASGIRH